MVTRKIILLSIFFQIGLLSWAQSARENEILQTESARFQAMMRADTHALRPMLADDLIYIHSNALKENKQGHLQTIGSGKIVYQSMERENASIRMYGKMAVNCGAIKVKGINSGNPFDLKMLYTAIYKKNRGRWQLHHWQSTRIP